MKFKIGDHVRVTDLRDGLCDRVGVVSGFHPGQHHTVEVSGLHRDMRFLFSQDQLTLADAQPHAAVGDAVNHPAHYGGQEDTYEAIKVIEAWGLGFHLGNTIKYIARADKKGNMLEDLRKARWYLDRFIAWLEAKK